MHLCPQQVVLDNVSSKAYADAVQAAEPDQGGIFHTCRAPACPSSAQSHAALASKVIQTIEAALSKDLYSKSNYVIQINPNPGPTWGRALPFGL